MKLPRRRFLQLTGGAAALPAVSRVARAQSYPTRPVRLIVGFPAGTTPDIIARLVGQWLSERLGQQFIIDNRPGASSNIATEFVAKAAPDGYTLLMAVSSNAVNAALYTNLNFDFARDIVPVAYFAGNPFVLVVTPSLPTKTLPEFIAYAKANPGKINMASQGVGTTPHVCGELLKMMTGIDFTHVPYRGPLMPDLLVGQVQFYFSPMPQPIAYIGTAGCGPSASPRRRARMRCRTSRRSQNLCRATKRTAGLALLRPKAHPSRSSTSSTMSSMPPSLIPTTRRALAAWAKSQCR
jgi:tripartite-type tricarboxylate transporter receptor subunit TctC